MYIDVRSTAGTTELILKISVFGIKRFQVVFQIPADYPAGLRCRFQVQLLLYRAVYRICEV